MLPDGSYVDKTAEAQARYIFVRAGCLWYNVTIFTAGNGRMVVYKLIAEESRDE